MTRVCGRSPQPDPGAEPWSGVTPKLINFCCEFFLPAAVWGLDRPVDPPLEAVSACLSASRSQCRSVTILLLPVRINWLEPYVLIDVLLVLTRIGHDAAYDGASNSPCSHSR